MRFKQHFFSLFISGGHVVSVTDQNVGGNIKSNDKSMEGQQTVTSQDVSSKEDGTNE